MERAGLYNISLPHSFSLPSLAEGSEPISEAEEFREMKSLREQGDKALKLGNFLEAINYYNEALEIDDKDKEVLLARANAQLKLGDYISAEKDVIILLAADPDSPQIHRLRGLVLMKLQQYKEALTAFLTALDLNPDNGDELTDFIAEVSAKFCNISEDYMQTIKGEFHVRTSLYCIMKSIN